MAEEKVLFVDYSVILETAIPAAFGKSTFSESSTGLRISNSFFEFQEGTYASISWTFFFQRRNPWAERFNWYLRLAAQAGLRDEWINRDK